MEERAYTLLLARCMTTASELARMLRISPRRIQRLLEGLEAKGLATHSPERPRRYIATPPEFAIEALASQRQADIERARAAIPKLKERSARQSGGGRQEQLVEVITSPVVLGQIIRHLHQTLQHEAFGFQRAPMRVPDSHQQEMRPGIRIRSVSDLEYLRSPGALESLRHLVAMGEEARIFPNLPVKMFIADRRTGLLVNAEDLDGPTLLVRSCPLLDALCAFFELIWERSTPLVFNRSGKLDMGTPFGQVEDVAEQIIPLLAAGLNDKAIASEAGISGTTLNRRIVELMKRFDTRTRFQLGWRAALETFPDRVNSVEAPIAKPGRRTR